MWEFLFWDVFPSVAMRVTAFDLISRGGCVTLRLRTRYVVSDLAHPHKTLAHKKVTRALSLQLRAATLLHGHIRYNAMNNLLILVEVQQA